MPKPNHIWVIRLSAMGDVAMTVPVLRVFAQTYPHVKLTVTSRKFLRPLFDDIPNLDFMEADVCGKHKGFGLIKLANEALEIGVDAVADLHNVIRSKVLSKYLFIKGLPVKTIDKGRSEKKAFVKRKNLMPLKTTVQRYADVFEKLGFPLNLEDHQFPKKKELSKKLHGLIGNTTNKLIGIAPFAAHESKMYPLKMMQEVIEKLEQTEMYKIFLFGGGKNEEAILKKWESQYKNTTNVAGILKFEEELALISNLDLMLAMDSGNGHLAAIYGIPVITLWGVTHPYAGFMPFNQPKENQLVSNRDKFPLIPTSIYGNKYPEGYEKAMETIPVELVFEKILSRL